MSVELILATSSITLALVFYTIGVFKERKAGILRLNHVLFFWTGLVFDVNRNHHHDFHSAKFSCSGCSW